MPQGGTYIQVQGVGVRDAHGTWFGSADGSIWLYTFTGTFEKVAAEPPRSGATRVPYDPNAARTIAGPCV